MPVPVCFIWNNIALSVCITQNLSNKKKPQNQWHISNKCRTVKRREGWRFIWSNDFNLIQAFWIFLRQISLYLNILHLITGKGRVVGYMLQLKNCEVVILFHLKNILIQRYEKLHLFLFHYYIRFLFGYVNLNCLRASLIQ